MHASLMTVALCAAAAVAAPSKARRGVSVSGAVDEVESIVPKVSVKVPEVGVDKRAVSVSEAVDEVEDVVPTAAVSLPEVAVDKRADEGLLEEVLAHVQNILDSTEPTTDKVQEILNTLVTDITARDDTLSRREIIGLDLDILDTLSLSGLLGDLGALVNALEGTVVNVVKEVDPAIASTLSQLLTKVDSVVSDVESTVGINKRGILGLDLNILGQLGVKDLLHDIEVIVSKVEKAVIKEVKGVDPALAKTVKALLVEVNSVTANVESAIGL